MARNLKSDIFYNSTSCACRHSVYAHIRFRVGDYHIVHEVITTCQSTPYVDVDIDRYSGYRACIRTHKLHMQKLCITMIVFVVILLQSASESFLVKSVSFWTCYSYVHATKILGDISIFNLSYHLTI